MEDALVKLFRRCGFSLSQERVTDRLQQLCVALGVDPAWTASHYEVFMSSREYTREVTEDLVDAFEEFARQQHRQGAKTFATGTQARRGGWENTLTTPVLADNTNLKQQFTKLKTPAKQLASDGQQNSAIAPSSTTFHNRPQRGTIVISLNGDLESARFGKAPITADGAGGCTMTLISDTVSQSQIFMVDRLQDKAAYLEERILLFASAVEAAEGWSVAHPVNVASQESVWVIGRVCCDSEGRLNENSILLEGSIKFSQGGRVRLNMSRLDAYRLIPGQIIAVEGMNASGHCLVASRIISSVEAPAAVSPVQDEAQPLSVVIASGQFTMSEDLSFEPLKELIQFCAQHKPNLLLLLGPFVDVDHPLIQSGMVDEAFKDTFDSLITTRLSQVAQLTSGQTRTVLIPSTRDAQHMPVFPQPAFDIKSPREGITSLGNPVTFCCNGVTFGVVAADVLRHMSAQEVQRGNAGSDRMAGLASLILGQQSYYPLFPPAVGMMLDTTLAQRLQLPATLDVLVLPSDLNSFAKLATVRAAQTSSTVCVNPGRLTKGSSGGTFAYLQVALGQEALDKRCKVEIMRI